MRKVSIVCVGSLKEKYWVEAVNEYKKRLSKYCDLSIVELPESRLYKNNSSEISAVIEDEGARILEKIKGKRVICLAIEGEVVSSEKLAETIERETDLGELVFVIGGSYGLSSLVKSAGNLVSFGRITLPHQLVRVVVLEQIYRGFTILNNTEYHK